MRKVWLYSIGVAVFGILLAIISNLTLLLRSQITRPDKPELVMTFTDVSYVSGIFSHDLQPVGPESGFRAKTSPRFGIIERDYPSDEPHEKDMTQWQRLVKYVRYLNEKDPEHERYKILFVARHGEGVHNVKEREVGRQEWDRHWSRVDGDGKTTWVDASLTEKGFEQARELGTFWRRVIEHEGVPLPQRFFSSPLQRCLQTLRTTWDHATFPELAHSRPRITEALRELWGVHTCDKRSAKTQIQAQFPEFDVESTMPENDELWTATRRETQSERAVELKSFLARLFEDDQSTYISLTTHSGATRALYAATGHPDVWTAPGSVTPLVLVARRRPRDTYGAT